MRTDLLQLRGMIHDNASRCRFEQTGLISLEGLIKLSMELGVIDEIKDLFTRPTYNSIEEVVNDST